MSKVNKKKDLEKKMLNHLIKRYEEREEKREQVKDLIEKSRENIEKYKNQLNQIKEKE